MRHSGVATIRCLMTTSSKPPVLTYNRGFMRDNETPMSSLPPVGYAHLLGFPVSNSTTAGTADEAVDLTVPEHATVTAVTPKEGGCGDQDDQTDVQRGSTDNGDDRGDDRPTIARTRKDPVLPLTVLQLTRPMMLAFIVLTETTTTVVWQTRVCTRRVLEVVLGGLLSVGASLAARYVSRRSQPAN